MLSYKPYLTYANFKNNMNYIKDHNLRYLRSLLKYLIKITIIMAILFAITCLLVSLYMNCIANYC